MELDKIIQMLKGKTEPKLVRFISDKGPNSCKACLKHHGKIFRADARDKPKLPIHPNCRCKYEEVKESDAKTQSSDQNNSKIGQFLRNFPEAVQNTLEMKFCKYVCRKICGFPVKKRIYCERTLKVFMISVNEKCRKSERKNPVINI